ncbi:hypothetical protein BayCH28_08835 [Mycolicibacterium sp. CH28]|nr:hypothetical protein BayCH28_08835 [Mycolicibacterium sp. CH28]
MPCVARCRASVDDFRSAAAQRAGRPRVSPHRYLCQRFADDPSMWLCHERIYRAVYQPNSRFL